MATIARHAPRVTTTTGKLAAFPKSVADDKCRNASSGAHVPHARGVEGHVRAAEHLRRHQRVRSLPGSSIGRPTTAVGSPMCVLEDGVLSRQEPAPRSAWPGGARRRYCRGQMLGFQAPGSHAPVSANTDERRCDGWDVAPGAGSVSGARLPGEPNPTNAGKPGGRDRIRLSPADGLSQHGRGFRRGGTGNRRRRSRNRFQCSQTRAFLGRRTARCPRIVHRKAEQAAKA